MSTEILDDMDVSYGQVLSATNAEGEITSIAIRIDGRKAKDVAAAMLDTIWTETQAIGKAILTELGIEDIYADDEED